MSTDPTENTAPRRRGLERWATAGSLAAAILASACCWLPLLVVAFGASAAGVGAVFAQVRPFFLGAAAVLLGAGFYLLYLRREPCAPGGACAVPAVRTRRFNRAMFWVAVVFIAAFAFFPNYVGYLLGGPSGGTAAVSAEQRELDLQIQGMTCEGCAANIRASLAQVDGVRAVEVSYERSLARVWLDDRVEVPAAALLAAIEKAGYHGSLATAAATEQAR